MNNIAQWIIVAIAVGGFIYSAIVTNVTLKNDVKHLQKSVDGLWSEINEIKNILIEKRSKL